MSNGIPATDGRDISPETVLRRRDTPAVEVVEVDGETVVYDCVGNALHVLDPIGTLLWALLDGTASLRSTSRDLASAFGRAEDEVLHDVVGFARHLDGIALVERVG